jgi:hypothetical protein
MQILNVTNDQTQGPKQSHDRKLNTGKQRDLYTSPHQTGNMGTELHQQNGQSLFFSCLSQVFSLILGFFVTFYLFFNFYKLCPQLL